jgi:DNA-binding FrmR family transcriptional regulator
MNKLMATKKIALTPRQNVSRRLRITEGHIRKVIEMVDSGVYCIDIMQQTAAVRSAIKKAEEVLLMNHLNNCVANAINSDGKEKAIAELGQVFRKID